MHLLGALGNRRKPVKATDGAAQRSCDKTGPIRGWFGANWWDRGRTSPVGLLLTLESTLMPGAAVAVV